MAEYSLKGVNKVEDMENMSDLEKKHLPAVHLPGKIRANEPFSVKVKVGEYLAHPNELGHFINWIAIYDEDYTFLGMTTLAPVVSHPSVRFTVSLDEPTTIRAFAYCNLHGLWQGKKEVKF